MPYAIIFLPYASHMPYAICHMAICHMSIYVIRLLEVEMWKKCMLLWCEAHFEVSKHTAYIILLCLLCHMPNAIYAIYAICHMPYAYNMAWPYAAIIINNISLFQYLWYILFKIRYIIFNTLKFNIVLNIEYCHMPCAICQYAWPMPIYYHI